MVPGFRFYLITELKKISHISFLRDYGHDSDHGLLVKNDQKSKTSRMLHNMAALGKMFYPTYQLWRRNTLHLTWCLVFLAFWSRSFLLNITLSTKSYLMIYNLSMFGIKLCCLSELWRHRYLGNWVVRKMW